MGNSSIAQQLYSYWNDREFDRLAELLTDDGEIVLVGSGTRFEGHEGAKEFSRMWADGFPDGKVEIDDVIEAGDRVVLQFTGHGTHTGTLRSPGGEIPATGRSVTLKLCDVHHYENGRIKSVHSYFDSASLLTQIGVMPAAGVATA